MAQDDPFDGFKDLVVPEISENESPPQETVDKQNPEIIHHFQGLAWYNLEAMNQTPRSSSPSESWASSQKMGLQLEYQYRNLLTLSGDMQLNTELVFSQFYLKLKPGDSFYLTLGEQRIRWGNYRVFSTLDILDPLADPLASNATQPGQALLQGLWIPNEYVSLTMLVMPEENLRWSRFGIKVDGLWEGLEWGMGVVKYYEGIRTSSLLSDQPQREDRWAGFAEMSWFPGFFGIYGEVSYKQNAIRQYLSENSLINLQRSWGAWRLSLGSQLTLPTWSSDRQMSLLVEYFLNQNGLSVSEAEDWMVSWNTKGSDKTRPLFSIGLGELRQHYGAIKLGGIPLVNDWSGSLMGIMSFDGEFGIWQGQINWKWAQGVNLAFSYQIQGAAPWIENQFNKLNEGIFLEKRWSQNVILSWNLSF